MREAAAGTSARVGVLSALRDARWIVGHRMRPYAAGAICIYVAWSVLGVIRGLWLFGPEWRPMPTDFIAFWSAARMAMAGQTAAAYDWAAHHAAQIAGIGVQFEDIFAWFNPPHFLLLLLPFGYLHYVVAWIAFCVVTGALYVAAFRAVLPVRGAWLLALAAPASFFCIIAGQLGFLVAALTASALLLKDSRPLLAGVSLALLTIKPQFGLLYPLLLIATGRMRVFAAAAAGTVALVIASAAAFGTNSWLAFVRSLGGEATDLLLRGGEDWTKLQSLYACFHLLTDREGLAMALHWACAAVVAAVVTWLWRMPASPGVQAAAAAAGAFLVTPRAYVYDAPLVAIAAAFLARDILARGSLPWERVLLCLAVLAPASFFVTESFATPVAMLIILALAMRRGILERGGMR